MCKQAFLFRPIFEKICLSNATQSKVRIEVLDIHWTFFGLTEWSLFHFSQISNQYTK